MQQLWKDVKHAAGSSKAVEDSIRMALSREAAKATIQEDEIFEIRSVTMTYLLDGNYRPATNTEELKPDAASQVEKKKQ